MTMMFCGYVRALTVVVIVIVRERSLQPSDNTLSLCLSVDCGSDCDREVKISADK